MDPDLIANFCQDSSNQAQAVSNCAMDQGKICKNLEEIYDREWDLAEIFEIFRNSKNFRDVS